MKCGECNHSARVYKGQNLDNSRYTYCSLRACGLYNKKIKSVGWTKVLKTSEPKWCPLKDGNNRDFRADVIGYCGRI